MQWAVLQPCHGKVIHTRVVFEIAQYRQWDLWADSKPERDAEHDTERRTTSKAKHEPPKTEASQPHLRSNTQTKTAACRKFISCQAVLRCSAVIK